MTLRIVKKAQVLAHGQVIFSIGTWVQGKSKFPKPVYFLKNTPEMVRALATFRVVG